MVYTNLNSTFSTMQLENQIALFYKICKKSFLKYLCSVVRLLIIKSHLLGSESSGAAAILKIYTSEKAHVI